MSQKYERLIKETRAKYVPLKKIPGGSCGHRKLNMSGNFHIQEEIYKKWEWFGYMPRMKNFRISKLIWEYISKNKRG